MRQKISHVLKNILKFIIVFIILIAVYMFTLFFACSFPSTWIKANIEESADLLVNRGEGYDIDVGYKTVPIFEYTNSLMLNHAYSIDYVHPIQSMLLVRKNFVPGMTEIVHENTSEDLKSAKRYYNEFTKETDAFQAQELFDSVYENELTESFEYARYWHGYLVYLRPLLLIFNYNQISFLSQIVFCALLAIYVILIGKNFSIRAATACIIAFISVDALVAAQSINEITCFTIALIWGIYIILKKGNDKNLGLLFFIIGSTTNFIDFLTNPIVVYGIAILSYFLIRNKNYEVTFEEMITIYFKTSVLWALGYGLTWASKWVIGDLIMHRNIISNALNQITYRTVKTNNDFEAIFYCIKDFVSLPVIFANVWIGIINFYSWNKIKSFKDFKFAIPYLIGILIPFVWYRVLLSHSMVHRFFTYRNVVVSLWSVQLAILAVGQKLNRLEERKG